MSGQVTITQLPTAAALTGSESVPVVQNGVTVQTTTGAVAGAGALNYPFLTVGSTAGLTQARYLSTTGGLSLTDGGVGSTLTINLTGAPSVLNTVGTGIIVKNSSSTVTNRSLTVGSGLTISNADGIAGNPAIGVSTNLQNLSSLSSIGFVAGNGSTFSELTFTGTTSQISIASGDGSAGGPVISIASNPILPGTGSVTVPQGTTAQRSGSNGALRYNTDTAALEGYSNGSWASLGGSGSTVSTFSAGTTGLTPSSATSGEITLAGTLNVASGGTGLSAYTAGDLLYYATGTALSKLGIGSNGQVLTSSGTAPQYVAQSTLSVGTAINVAGGTTGAIHYQSGAGATAFLTGNTSTTPQFVTSTGTGSVAQAPTLTSSTGSGNVVLSNSPTLVTPALGTPTALVGTNISGTATNLSIGGTASTATNVAGGAAGSLVYQTGSGATSTLALGTSGYILTAGASAPTYIQTLPIANGGTNATTASAARTNLSAAQSGTNTDITSIALTTGTVSTAPSANTDIVNKLYADSIASGINFHAAAQYATTANLSTVTYNNGSSGVGATITNAGTQAALTIDGYTFTSTDATNATRVLVKNQSTQSQNGIYTVTNQGSGSTNWVLTRATDYDTSGTGTNEVDQGDFILVIGGTANANTSWVQQTPLPITIGTTNIVFIQFGAASGGVSSFTAGSTGFTPNTATTGAITLAGTLNVANGGTGQTSYTDGQLLIGNSTGNTLTKSTLTAGSGITITNAGGSITIASSGVSSFNAGTTGFTPNTATTGAVTLAGTLNIANGGTGSTSLAGASIATYTGTETLTNKRINPRFLSQTSTATLAPDISAYDQYNLTAQAATLSVSAPIGTPVDGNKLIFRILDNGTARAITWNATYTVIGVTLPTTTTVSKTTYVGCIYNANNTRWDVIAVTTQA